MRRRLRYLRWILPGALLLFVIGYELGPANWLLAHYGQTHHLIAEILVYGTIGPLIAFVLLTLLGRWLEERETSELQSQLLAQARAKVHASRELTDRALQELFAASMQFTALESSLPPPAAAEVRAVRQALDHAIEQMRSALLEDGRSD